MARILLAVGIAAWLLGGGDAIAAERTVTLKIDNMTCVTCPYIVRESLAKVDGVKDVEVSFADEIAVVTFDDSETDVSTFVAATSRYGFPSALLRAD